MSEHSNENMNIVKKQTRYLDLGDIIIIDWLKVKTDNLPVSIKCVGKNCTKKIFNKFEGESQIFLFEIDDVTLDAVSENWEELEDDKISYKYTYHHIKAFTEDYPDLVITGIDDYEWDVIEKPTHQEHYQNVINPKN